MWSWLFNLITEKDKNPLFPLWTRYNILSDKLKKCVSRRNQSVINWINVDMPCVLYILFVNCGCRGSASGRILGPKYRSLNNRAAVLILLRLLCGPVYVPLLNKTVYLSTDRVSYISSCRRWASASAATGSGATAAPSLSTPTPPYSSPSTIRGAWWARGRSTTRCHAPVTPSWRATAISSTCSAATRSVTTFWTTCGATTSPTTSGRCWSQPMRRSQRRGQFAFMYAIYSSQG